MPDITPAPSDRKPDTTRRSWHRKASRPVSGWLLALLIVAVASPWIPQSRWLLVHMITLGVATTCLLYTSPSPRDRQKSRMPSSA